MPRFHRKDVFSYLKKNFAEYFDSKEPQKDLEVPIKNAEAGAEKIENAYIDSICGEDMLPMFDFDINLNDADWTLYTNSYYVFSK